METLIISGIECVFPNTMQESINKLGTMIKQAHYEFEYKKKTNAQILTTAAQKPLNQEHKK